ncbi:hypothetical protein ACFYPZ_37440 [Streptomyces sp. NPDC005506]|uniref:hypothetical protein n=1 Tax=Streptomyces sp. NPDC005506 TaxID=3364718 RepID=UPI003699DD25
MQTPVQVHSASRAQANRRQWVVNPVQSPAAATARSTPQDAAAVGRRPAGERLHPVGSRPAASEEFRRAEHEQQDVERPPSSTNLIGRHQRLEPATSRQ